MARCAYCNSPLWFMRKRVGDVEFCTDTCAANGQLLFQARAIPEAEALELAGRMAQGPCPRCHGPGPIDVYTSHQVWSALLLTSWKSTPSVSCRRCSRKAQATDLTVSFFL